MKVVVYAIALNEAKHVEQFYESVKAADEVVVCDTGSTDQTSLLLRKIAHARKYASIRTYNISVVPWRFDVARNTCLSLVPDADACICLDLDEVLVSDWRPRLEDEYAKSYQKYKRQPGRTTVNYTYAFNEDGTPNLQFVDNRRIHSRYGYVWRYPMHESLEYCGEDAEIQVNSTIEIHHHQDKTKDRTSRTDGCYRGFIENPLSPRCCFYYARELYYRQEWEKMIIVGEKFENMLMSTGIQMENDWIQVPDMLSIAYANVGRYQDAISQARMALRSRVDTERITNNIGLFRRAEYVT